MTKKTQGAGDKPAPRGDTTQARRQSKRQGPLNQKAIDKGWTGISEYITALKSGDCDIPEFTGTSRRKKDAPQ